MLLRRSLVSLRESVESIMSVPIHRLLSQLLRFPLSWSLGKAHQGPENESSLRRVSCLFDNYLFHSVHSGPGGLSLAFHFLRRLSSVRSCFCQCFHSSSFDGIFPSTGLPSGICSFGGVGRVGVGEETEELEEGKELACSPFLLCLVSLLSPVLFTSCCLHTLASLIFLRPYSESQGDGTGIYWHRDKLTVPWKVKLGRKERHWWERNEREGMLRKRQERQV